jgi:hypothetical protein
MSFNNTPAPISTWLEEKQFFVDLTSNAYVYFVSPFQQDNKIALVTDDMDMFSVKSLANFGDRLDVYVLQFDQTIYDAMTQNMNLFPYNVKAFWKGDFVNSVLDIPNSIVIDQVSLNCGWKKVKNSFEMKFRRRVYANRAIVCLTLCGRNARNASGQSFTMLEFSNDIITEFTALADDTPYFVKPLSVKQICKYLQHNGFTEESSQNVAYQSPNCEGNRSQYVTIWFLVGEV